MIENQEELRTALGKIADLKQRLKQLEDSQTSNLGKPFDDMTSELETLQTQVGCLLEAKHQHDIVPPSTTLLFVVNSGNVYLLGGQGVYVVALQPVKKKHLLLYD